MKLDQPTIFEL